MRREPALYSNQFVCVECHNILAMVSLSRPSSLIVPPLVTFRGLVDQFLPWLLAICRTPTNLIKSSISGLCCRSCCRSCSLERCNGVSQCLDLPTDAPRQVPTRHLGQKSNERHRNGRLLFLNPPSTKSCITWWTWQVIQMHLAMCPCLPRTPFSGDGQH